jgi:hypothetical protein
MEDQYALRPLRASCCHCSADAGQPGGGITRRSFLQGVAGAALAGAIISKPSWALLPAVQDGDDAVPGRRPLVVKPILTYDIPTRRPQTSWRSWGGIQTQAHVDEEVRRIQAELSKLVARADFPVELAPVAAVRGAGDLAGAGDLDAADAYLVYAAGGWVDTFDMLGKTGKDVIFFCRHKSGPVYLWYEIISPRYLRQHTDSPALDWVRDEDVVVDSQDEILWRLRSLCGLRNTLGTRMLAVGGPSAWAQPEGDVPTLVRNTWKFDIQTVSYDDLGNLIKEARADEAAVRDANRRADTYLGSPGTRLETDRGFVENAFLLEQIFRRLMKQAGCRSITINNCMGTIMPLAETTACLPLSLLNDAGYLAFCESDFVAIPAGVLMANITGTPVFMNDPTYPHDGIITLAHCTAPRKVDGKTSAPARILTHFESDYGAAPKVEMRRGQTVTAVVADFAEKRWVGLGGEIVDTPFLDICRSQIDVRFGCDGLTLAERMPGFHWMIAYGDHRREVGYALRRVGIEWDCIG